MSGKLCFFFCAIFNELKCWVEQTKQNSVKVRWWCCCWWCSCTQKWQCETEFYDSLLQVCLECLLIQPEFAIFFLLFFFTFNFSGLLINFFLFLMFTVVIVQDVITSGFKDVFMAFKNYFTVNTLCFIRWCQFFLFLINRAIEKQ